jgi:hypothetical protein
MLLRLVFTLVAIAMSLCGQCSSPAVITVGGTLSGALSPTCVTPAVHPVTPPGTYYGYFATFTTTAPGQQIAIDVIVSPGTNGFPAFDSYIYLLGPAFNVIAEDDDGSEHGTDSRIPSGSGSFRLLSAGQYTIVVTSLNPGETGSFTLRLTSPTQPGCAPGAIGVGQTLNGMLASGDCISPTRGSSYADRFSFVGNAGQQISIDLTSTVFDTYLFLIAPDGGVLTGNDDVSSTNIDSRIPLSGLMTLPVTGTYIIEVASFDVFAQGAYALSLSSTSACIFYLDSISGGFPDSGGVGRVHVALGTMGCSWTATSNASWITITAGSSSPSSGDVNYTVAPNTGTTRTGTMTIAGQTFTVTQMAGCSFNLSLTSATAPWQGTKATFQLTASNPACPWTSYTTANWLQRYPQSGTGSATIEYTVYPSMNTFGRTSLIHIAGRTFTLTQLFNPLPPDDRFVTLVYFGFYGRVPTAGESSLQVNALRSGLSRTDLAVNLFNSDEFNNNGRFISGLYVGIVGRDAEYTGWVFQRDALLNGLVSQNQLVSSFLGSAEYQLKYGNPTNDEFVKLLHRNILRREPTSSELSLYVSQLLAGFSRTQVASSLLNGAEFRQSSGPKLTAFLQYASLLLRDAEQWERDYWANLMTAGMTVRDVFVNFVNSAEIAIQLQ